MKNNIAIKVQNVSKEFDLRKGQGSFKSTLIGLLKSNKEVDKSKFHALKNIDFEIKKGEFFGIVGRNGSGKSTLLKIMAGVYSATHGQVYTEGRLVPFIELGVGFNPELSGRDNVFLNGALLGFSRGEMEKMYGAIVEFAELEDHMDVLLKNYSSGMQVRLAFSIAIRSKADILLIDEVLAVGDASFQKKCFSYFKSLKNSDTTVVLVTHDMTTVEEYCDRALMINNSEVVAVGKPSKIARKYSMLFIDEAKRKKEIEDEEQQEVGNEKRWGNGKAIISDIKVSQKNNKILVNYIVKAVEPGQYTYGLHIRTEDGIKLVATNNDMLRFKKINLGKKGETSSVEWIIDNVLNSGEYFLSLTLTDDLKEASDWIEDAADFSVDKLQKSNAPVLPGINIVL